MSEIQLYIAVVIPAAAVLLAVPISFVPIQWAVPRPIMVQSILIGAGLTLVHAYGALRHAQPMIETIETAIYAAITIWGISLYIRFY